MRGLLLLCFLALPGGQAYAGAQAGYVAAAIQNDAPRMDLSGSVVDAHDGSMQFFDGRYYLYGTAYGPTAGFSINNRFRVYSSSDLQTWRYEGEILQAPPDGVYYRPYVVFNAATRKYVLWYNWYPSLWNGQVGVATSDTPVGPFTIQNANVQLAHAAAHPGDGSLFVDKDGTGYFAYTVIGENHSIYIERLTRDYLGSTLKSSAVLGTNCEAPALFRRENTYYALFDRTCCFCQGGSGAQVYRASSPLGPYTLTGNIDRDTAGKPIVAAQQTWVAALPSPDGTSFLWMGDRWRSNRDGIKGHDLQFWAPLVFRADGTIAPLADVAQATLTIRRGRPGRPVLHPYAWPLKPDPHPLQRDACTGTPLTPVQSGAQVPPFGAQVPPSGAPSH